MSEKDLVTLYLEQVLEANKTTNLTRITSWEEALILHIEDSLVGLDYLNAAPDGLYGDLGTGGGFPGVPLAIYSGRKTVLIDSVKKKVAILKKIVEEIGLSDQISAYAGRIEDLAKEQPESFAVLTARALSQLNSLLELSSPLLKKGGRLICYKARVSEEEIEAALSVSDLVGMRLVERKKLYLSDEETIREILVFEKFSTAKIKLPRNIGMAQRNPLTKNRCS